MQYTDPRVEVPVFHLHGTPFGPSTSPIVITQTDYARYQDKRRMLWNRLRNEFATSTFLYIGYSGNDPNWQLVLDEVRREFYPSEMPLGFRLDPHAEDIDIEIFDDLRLHTLVGSLDDFREVTDRAIGNFRPDIDIVSRNKGRVPAHLQEPFEKQPAMVLRLLDSWDYINAADLAHAANIKAFLNGERPNWALIDSDRKFSRDIETEVWEKIEEFATHPAAKSMALSLVAPAGYGVTTTLMTLAMRIVKGNIGPVLMLREGQQVLEGDVQFATTLFPGDPIFFFVDQGREHASSLALSIAQQRRTKANCLFVVGERKNEWHMASGAARLKSEEFEIEPLSDAEINALLDFLTRESALGKLEFIDRDFPFQVVKNKHEKELLVAMREATDGEGLGFDAIIENEFRGIESTTSTAKDLYLLVCCFYQHGVLIRDQLAELILGIPLKTIYEETVSPLEGLVTEYETDKSRGEFALRARHRTIAEIVWRTCGAAERKETLLQSAMENLNLFYSLDKSVFERFVRSEKIAETFRTLEGKIRFFEAATKRAPDDPYVLQHYARMLHRARQYKLALAQADAST